MYDLGDYLAMVEDERRTRAYLAAMAQVIRPGDVVLELGTGFGFFAVHAARLGATVIALEPEDAIAHGPAFAAANGVADRIRFVQASSLRFETERRADALVEDLRGTSPLHQGRLVALLDARARLLKPGARVIPRRDTFIVAPAPQPRGLGSDGAFARADHIEGIDVRGVRAALPHSWRRARADQVDPLASPTAWTSIDYATFTSLDAEGDVTCRIERGGRLDGLATWFATELAPGIGYDTGPDARRSVYDIGWFPLETPIEVRPGDDLRIRLRAKFDGRDYLWAWETEWRPSDGRAAPVAQRHSNLLQRALSPARLARRASTHVPEPREDTAMLAEALALVDGHRSLAEIADALRARHPTRFADDAAALRWVAERLARIEEDG